MHKMACADFDRIYLGDVPVVCCVKQETLQERNEREVIFKKTEMQLLSYLKRTPINPSTRESWSKRSPEILLDLSPLLVGDLRPLLEVLEFKEKTGAYLDHLSCNHRPFTKLAVVSGFLPLIKKLEKRKIGGFYFRDTLSTTLSPNALQVFKLSEERPEINRPLVRQIREFAAKDVLEEFERRLAVQTKIRRKAMQQREEVEKERLAIERKNRGGEGKEDPPQEKKQYKGKEKEEEEGELRPTRNIPSLKDMSALVLASTVVTSPHFDPQTLEEVPDEVLCAIGKQFRSFRQPMALQFWDIATKKIPRLSKVTDYSSRIQLFQSFGHYHRAIASRGLCPFNPRNCIELLCLFEKYETFIYDSLAPGSVNVPLIFPQPALTRLSGFPSVVKKDEFLQNFEAYTRGQLKNMDWSNIVVIGGTLGTCLTPLSSLELIGNVEYFDQVGGNDIDLCLIGLKRSEVKDAVRRIYKSIKESIPTVPVTIITTREAITFMRHFPYRSIQIMGNFSSISACLATVDIDATAMAFDGKDIWATHRCREALNTRINTVDVALYPIRSCPQYERRFLKYKERGFSIADLDYEPNNTLPIEEPDSEKWTFAFDYEGRLQSGRGLYPGVGRKLLLLCEKYPWVEEQLMNNFAGSGSVPYGPTWTRRKVKDYLEQQNWSSTPFNPSSFDSYTIYFSPPRLVLVRHFEKALDKLSISNDSVCTLGLCPIWDFGSNPNLILKNEMVDCRQWLYDD